MRLHRRQIPLTVIMTVALTVAFPSDLSIALSSPWGRVPATTPATPATAPAAAASALAVSAGASPSATIKPGTSDHATIDPGTPADATTVTLRKFPYPYDAMLAIASDADGMTSRKFELIHRFLNTREHTALGLGLGLDIGDSFFFYIGTDRPGICDIGGTPWRDQMSYFYHVSTSEWHDAAAIIAFAHAGWIDSLHGLGDFSMQDEKTTSYRRPLAVVAVKEIRENGLPSAVWINHGNRSNVENFGNPESPYQKGDVKGAPYRVTDLLAPLGIRFVWTRRAAAFGLPSMIYPAVLRDGRKVWGFYRYTDDGYTPDGHLRWNWNPRQLSEQLSAAHLEQLRMAHQYAIIAQHLGGDAGRLPIYGENVTALIRLMREYRHGRILVARTSRLLQYNEAEQYLQYRVSHKTGRTQIDITGVADPVLGYRRPSLNEVRGITFYTANPGGTDLYLDGRVVAPPFIQRNPPDSTGWSSVGIRWWPEQTRDVTRFTPVDSRGARNPVGPPSPPGQPGPQHFLWTDDPL